MDWDSKLSPWEIPELEQNHLHPNQITLNPISIGPSPSPFQGITHQIGLKDCSIDLKLGGSTDQSTNLGVFQKDQSRVAICTHPPVKRARGPASQTQMIVLCSVDGCGSDLSNCRDYHRRHKVCETHSKTPIVLVGGKEQRFCQQCSRFHMLTEFDELKKSCRKRLDGHNRRRRKPQPDSVNHHNVNQFSNYPSIFRTTSIPETTWAGSGSKTLISHPYLAPMPAQQSFSLSFPQNLKETKRFPFLYESTPTSNPFSKPIPFSVSVSSESSGSGSSSGGGNSNKIIYSECALSLLSSPPPTAAASAAAAASDLTVGPTCQSLFSGYQYPPSVTATGFALDDLHEGNAFVSDSDSGNGMGIEIGIGNGNSGLGFHCQNVYHVSNEGPSSIGEGSSQALPFWHH